MSQKSNQPLNPNQLSNLAEEQEFSSFLAQRLYSNSKTSKVPKSKKRFVIQGKEREKKRQKLDEEIRRISEEKLDREIPEAGTVNFGRTRLGASSVLGSPVEPSLGSSLGNPFGGVNGAHNGVNDHNVTQTARLGRTAANLPPVKTVVPLGSEGYTSYEHESLASSTKSPFWFISKIKKQPSSMEFVYLNLKKGKGAEPFNPYNLEIVPHSKINKDDYYTMSSKGVTHFQNGEATYITLDKWVKEHDNYKMILDLKFFSQYRVWKAFYFMKKYVITKRTVKAKKVLNSKLFHLSTILREPLMKVRQHCLDLQKLELFHDKRKIFALEEFADIQKERREKVHEQISQTIDAITTIVADACQKSMIAAGFGDRFQDFGDMANFDSQYLDIGSKNAPFQNDDEPYQLSYTEKSQKRRECKKLVSFIRLVDYLIVDSLMVLNEQCVQYVLNKVTMLTESVDESNEDDLMIDANNTEAESSFYEKDFETSQDANLPLFRTTVGLNSRKLLAVLPDKEDFDKKLDHLIKGFLKAIKVERLLQKKEFNEYIEPLIQDQREDLKLGEGPRAEMIIVSDDKYNELTRHIRSTLFLSCDRVLEYVSTFETLRQIYFENENFSIEAIRTAKPSLEWFRQEIEKYKGQIDLVRRMQTTKNLGMFLVDSKDLKDLFTPSPKRCLNAIYAYLPVMARESNEELFAELREGVTILQTPPSTVEDFVQYLNDVQRIGDDLQNLEDRFDYVADIYKLLEDEKAMVPPEDKESFTVRTVSTITTLRAALQLAEDSKEDRTQKFSVDVERKFAVFREKVNEIQEQACEDIISDETAEVNKVITFLTELKNEIYDIREKAKQLSHYQDLFGAPPDEIENQEEVAQDVELKLKLWTSLRDFEELSKSWNATYFRDLDLNEMKLKVDSYNFVGVQVEKGLPDNPVTGKLIDQVDVWKALLPVFSDMKNQYFQGRHWQKLDSILGQPLFMKMNQPPLNPDNPDENLFDVNQLIELNVVDKRLQIEEVSQEASNEHALLDLLGTVEAHWEVMEFEISIHKEMFIIGDTEEIVTQLEDDIITISTILSSTYVTAIKAQVEKWDHDLHLVFDTIEQWVKCQQKWIYLENVFSAPDIASQLEEENKLFKTVNRFFRDTMKRTNENRNVLSACTQNIGLYEKLKSHNVHLAKIDKALEAYLERKRNDFPRMYFLSNDDLLDILSQTENPNVVQPHLEKMFDSIKSLDIDDGNIRAMTSSEGEKVPFYRSTLKVGYGNVEGWLTEVEDAMFETVKRLIKQAVKDYAVQDRNVWIKSHFCQIVLTVSQIFWAREVTKCLSTANPLKSLEEFLEKSKKNLNYLAQMARDNLSRLERKIVTTLIIIDVHARDVLEQMIADKVSSPTDFGWLKQLRYEWDKEQDHCLVKQTNSSFQYGYEYLGCKSRLVITPLTDRIYMTLTGALHLNMGGSPAGPAGTGKTETVKDLAKAMAVNCIVYNCSDGVTYKMMYKFFSGIVQTGAWACFDEFNRINIEVLSVIASQLQTIQAALRAKLTRFEFEEGKEIALRHSCGVFITMNPGYAGRTELPDNLKALFRPVACMVPDYGLIAQVILYSEGYEDAKNLSRKMVQLYKLSNEQLSNQDHYDFGMRAMKSVLVMAGELKRANPNNPEDLTLMKAMKDSNIPKFVLEDVSLFEGIVGDLFPNVKETVIVNESLMSGIHEILRRRNLQVVDKFIRKVVQLFDTTVVRHGVMLVGPTGSGKTTNRALLADVMTYLRKEKNDPHPSFQKVKQYALNPKCITYGQLYGVFNLLTQEWFDGLIPHFARKAVKDESDDRKWLIFDGPVDTLWIESMNSVLDDSKLLCLDNTERIQLNDKINFLFEVEDLSQASPATVSRCGMVYMDPTELGWKPHMRCWIAQLPSDLPKKYITSLIEQHIDPLLTFVRTECEEYIRSVDLNLATSLFDLFLGIVKFEKLKFEGIELDEEGVEHLDQFVETRINQLFTFAAVWSIGANIKEDNRSDFEKYFREQLGRVCSIPSFGSVYDFTIDFENSAWTQWEEPDFVYNPSIPYFEIMVPTADTVRYGYFLQVLTQIEKPVLFSGVSGVGKSAIINNTLVECRNSLGLEQVGIQFSAQTSAGRTQKMIELKLVHRKNILKAPPGKKVVLFIDDMNMPQLEEFGAQPPVELIRQLISYHGFYDVEDRENFTWKHVEDVTIVAACGPPGGGRNHMSARTNRLFHLFNLPNLSDESKNRIFNCILSGFLQQGFHEEVKGISKTIVKAAVDLYNRICDDFRPTPSCAHYTFNLRDLSKVFQGILQATPDTVKKSNSLIRLWLHENMRCFYDRLNTSSDREKFADVAVEILRRHFRGATWDAKELFEDSPVMFTKIMKMDLQAREYEEVQNSSKIPVALDDYLGQYNVSSQSKMDLVFFPDAAQHTCRITRILSQERGNALLVGVGGVGKQSLTRISASICGYTLFEIKLKRGYSLNDFREDLKQVFLMAGVEGKHVVFLFSDFQIVEESFLEDINNILNSGEVPNLFPPEERERAINDVRPFAREAGISESRDAVYKYFINRVRDHLHIVLCMSPVGDAFRTRCRMFPSLVNCCTIDWFDEWPLAALESVAERKFLRVKTSNEDTKKALISMCPYIHQSVIEQIDLFEKELGRKVYVTPASYLQFIKFYHKLLDEKTSELNSSRSKLKKGLEILKKTNEDVSVMKKELEELQPVLKKQTETTEQILKEVSAGTKEANAKRVVIAAEEKIVSEKTKKAEALAKESEERLAEAVPTLLKAQKALESINKGDIAEIRRYTTPPDAVAVVLNAVQTLFAVKKPDWEGGVKLMSSSGFVTQCLEFDKENIPEKIIATLKKKYLPHPLFDEEVVKRKSGAAASLCTWVRAMVRFHDVNQDVIPLKEALKKSKAELEKMSKELKEKQEELRIVEEQVTNLNIKYDKNMTELKDLEARTALAERRLKAAEKLTGSLADEYSRWSVSIDDFDVQLVDLPGNIFFAAACVVYTGPFTAEFRSELTELWIKKIRELGIPLSKDCSLIKILGDQVKIRDWSIAGLPTDKQSIENAIITMTTDRWPLMIDPQGQATGWISNMEKMAGLKPIQMTTPNYLRTIDNAIRIGTPVLMENLPERIDPPLDPLLQKEVFKKQGRLVIQMGGNETEYNSKFKFYMTTKLGNPHYLPEVCNKVTLINFTVTTKGLEDQLLGDVVRQLKREWEEEKDRLVLSVAEDSKMLKDLEDQILNSLSSVGDQNILDNNKIIKTLDDSKFMANVIVERVTKAADTEKKINIAREDYRSVASRGSILYFVMADLAKIDPMYQYSLEYFKKLFNAVIKKRNESKSEDIELAAFLQQLIDAITITVYNNVCRGLFEKDKHIFSFLTCIQILIHAGKVKGKEFSFFLRGSPSANPPEKTVSWIEDRSWGLLVTLEKDFIPNLLSGIQSNSTAWKNWVESNQPFMEELPSGVTCSSFQKLLILKCLREEKIMYASKSFIETHLGTQFTRIPPLDLATTMEDTTCETPIIFILSQGADPVENLKRYADKVGYGERLHMKSLGQGQEESAKRLIERGVKSGDWILLQNCHLSVSFMPELEREIARFSSRGVHEDFRLFLTSMPSPHFPIPILQNGVKLTTEAPKGIRANLAQTWTNMDKEFFDSFNNIPEKEIAFKKLLFGLSSFHAIIQERKKFGPLGWTILYEFNDADLQVAKLWLQIFLNEDDAIPWDSLKYVIGEIVYGGRVTDPWDMRLILEVLYRYFTPEILKPTFKIGDDNLYTIPQYGDLEAYREYVDKLPLIDTPDLFSMHPNADIVFQQQEASKLIETIVHTQRGSATGTKKGGDDSEIREKIQKLLDDLPEQLSKVEAGPNTFIRLENGALHSLSTVLKHEMERFNKLLNVIRSSLNELLKAMDGLVVLSSELEKMFECLLVNEVPQVWEDAAYPSLKTLDLWITDLISRVAFMRNWLVNGTPNVFWISGFFFPQGLMTGVLQTYARKHHVAIDTLDFAFKVLTLTEEEIQEGPEDGIYVTGMFMDGAKWDYEQQCIVECEYGEIRSKLPVIHFLPEVNHVTPKDVYQSPLYKTSVRQGVLSSMGQSTNFILSVELPCSKDPSFFTLMGSACLCQDD